MSRTHRKHESLGRQHKRGPKNRTDIEALLKDGRAVRKPLKQRRPNERVALRKEYL